ncbi:hypothetical protein HY496_03395 [Candidatus Woesearchaeota archaeon]|nr:hypothetical protein [Candidatus Woesearchaeota archaeon]
MTPKIPKRRQNSDSTLLKGKSGIFLVSSQPQDYAHHKIALLKLLTSHYSKGIFISFNLSCQRMTSEFVEQKINPSRVLFIEGIGSERRVSQFSNENCYTLRGPRSLTELSIIILKKLEDKNIQYVFFDSVLTLLTYNGPETTERFIHYLTRRLRDRDIKCVFLSIEGDASQFNTLISQFCDRFILL